MKVRQSSATGGGKYGKKKEKTEEKPLKKGPRAETGTARGGKNS